MSVNLSQPATRKRHWVFSLWPLLLFALLLALGARLAWHYWPQLLLQSVMWQKGLHLQMAGLLQQVKAAPQQAGLALMLFSLSYGVLHALGPGHGKVVIATYLATHPARLKSSLKLTFAASLCRAGGHRPGNADAGGAATVITTVASEQFLVGEGQFCSGDVARGAAHLARVEAFVSRGENPASATGVANQQPATSAGGSRSQRALWLWSPPFAE
jgi:hypothetical protein